MDLSANTSVGGKSAFSTSIETASLTVNSVNDAPKLNTTPQQVFPAINEDTFNSNGKTVAALVTGVSDADAGALKGIAIISVTGATTGRWQYTLNAGATWTNVGAVSSNSALLLPSNGSLSKLRYVPNANFNVTVTMNYRGWDRTSGSIGTKVNVSTAASYGGSKAFSTAIETASLTVTPVNDAPRWLSTTPVPLGSISNTVNSPSYLVSSLLSGQVSDADSGALQGIAITAMTPAAAGTLWYQLSGSTVWKQVTAVSTSSALLLPSNAKLQFRPAAGFVGSFRTSFRVWDRTTGTVEGRAALNTDASTGLATAFSSALGQAELLITN